MWATVLAGAVAAAPASQLPTHANTSSSRGLAMWDAFGGGDLTSIVQNPSTAVSQGVQLICYGPFYVPSGARSLYQFLPIVDMGIVHHMILTGGSASLFSRAPTANSDSCYRGKIVYAWARGKRGKLSRQSESCGARCPCRRSAGTDTRISHRTARRRGRSR